MTGDGLILVCIILAGILLIGVTWQAMNAWLDHRDDSIGAAAPTAAPNATPASQIGGIVTAPTGKPAPTGNQTHADIAAYNEQARALDALIHAPIMRSYARNTWSIGIEDRRLIAEARSILVDAEHALLVDDSQYRCWIALGDAVDKLRFITDKRKRNIQHANVQRGLDDRVRAALDVVRAGCEHLATNLTSGFAKRSER